MNTKVIYLEGGPNNGQLRAVEDTCSGIGLMAQDGKAFAYVPTDERKVIESGSYQVYEYFSASLITAVDKYWYKDVSKEIRVNNLLRLMLESDSKLYEQILDTPGFAKYFNDLVQLAQKP